MRLGRGLVAENNIRFFIFFLVFSFAVTLNGRIEAPIDPCGVLLATQIRHD
jgi:hypothetical protein